MPRREIRPRMKKKVFTASFILSTEKVRRDGGERHRGQPAGSNPREIHGVISGDVPDCGGQGRMRHWTYLSVQCAFRAAGSPAAFFSNSFGPASPSKSGQDNGFDGSFEQFLGVSQGVIQARAFLQLKLVGLDSTGQLQRRPAAFGAKILDLTCDPRGAADGKQRVAFGLSHASKMAPVPCGVTQPKSEVQFSVCLTIAISLCQTKYLI